MPFDYLLCVFVGAILGGFVSGLSGFGTGITALGVWLYVLSPAVAATLVIVCSICSQILTLPKIWLSVEPKRVIPFLAPGLIAVPIGTIMLSGVDPRIFKLSIGCLLLLYSIHSLAKRSSSQINWGGKFADGVVGFSSGVLGGFAGLSGPLLTIWADVRGWTKQQKRSLFQVFNLSILCIALASHFLAGLVTKELGIAIAIAVPGTFFGTWIGSALYMRLSDYQFKVIVLFLLCISGFFLILTNL